VNGKIVFTRRVNLGNYEHKECSADISFNVADEDDWLDQKGIVDRAADFAAEVVETRLGIRKPSEVTAAVLDRVQQSAAQHLTSAAIHDLNAGYIVPPRKNKAPPQPVPVTVAQLPQFVMDPLSEDATLPETDDDPLASAGVVSAASAPANGAASGDTLADLDAELAEIPREVHNDELHTACRSFVQQHGTRGKVALQRLLAGYSPQIAGIPMTRRLPFLGELAVLAP